MLSIGPGPQCEEDKGVTPFALNGLRSWANAEHASAEPEPMLSLSMTILAKSSNLGQMIIIWLEAYHLTLCYSLLFVFGTVHLP